MNRLNIHRVIVLRHDKDAQASLVARRNWDGLQKAIPPKLTVSTMVTYMPSTYVAMIVTINSACNGFERGGLVGSQPEPKRWQKELLRYSSRGDQNDRNLNFDSHKIFIRSSRGLACWFLVELELVIKEI